MDRGDGLIGDENKGPRSAASYLKPLLENYGGLRGPAPITTGFQFLDQAMGGWRPGLHLVAGEPGCGTWYLILVSGVARTTMARYQAWRAGGGEVGTAPRTRSRFAAAGVEKNGLMREYQLARGLARGLM